MELNSIADIASFLTDEAAAQQAFADLRWPNGNVTCPLCEGGKKVYEVAYVRRDARTGEVKPTVRKQWKCGACRKKFSVTSGSIFEGAHIPVGKWIYAIYMMCSSKKGVSANQLSRQLKLSYKSAWFMCHRVREAMLQEPLAGMLGSGPDAIVELDETFVGGKKKNNRHRNRTAQAGKKAAVMTLIDREGDVKTVHVPNVRKGTLQELARPIVDQSANIVTDAHLSYTGLDQYFHSHHTVDHSQTFVRGIIFHTNFAESYHSLLKRGIIGAFHHVSDKHLSRYLAEFDRRWNSRKMTDGDRAVSVLRTAPSKRLRYAALVG
ncbi:IS1595 family transposase [Sphingosinicella ginsenosidimutans]|uniref:IS1595 family transposase n=1 Tax=Allosphingosinicella ginsenosidimutans TaxID=1176539 RepID=A0A5C6TR17_9SPHN|nr:IS1595 family transposase [Sphingosinicella ginsenosidimutans]TXC62620.1 IS1595 family transposase [Sphingosinicella ginsenosidimutans]